MSYRVAWYVKNRVVFVCFSGDMPEEEFDSYARTMDNYMEQAGSAIVHVILDDSRVTRSPSFQQVSRMMGKKHPHMGWGIAVGNANVMTRFLSSVVTQLAGIQYMRVATLDDAVKLLKDIDKTVVWDNADDSVFTG